MRNGGYNPFSRSRRRRRYLATVGIAAAVVVLGAGVAWKLTHRFRPESGYVLQHDYKPAHTYEQPDAVTTTLCTGSGSTFSCTSVVVGWTSHTVYVPDRWYLKIRDDRVDGRGRHQEGWVPVDRATFDGYSDGSHWPDPR